ncbi:unconventional myosin-XV [Trichonephila clavipes]|nr:unconventional myosin-XV [Trichonephila clavipes]
MKRNVVDVAKEFPNYFSRLFPISGGRNLPNVQLLGVSHSGVRLVRRERDAICDYLRVLDTISFEDIAEVSVPRSSTIQILLRNGGWMTLYSHKAEKIRNMVERYCVEAAQGGHEYVRAVADYVTRESTLLSFRENDIIRVVKNRNLHLDKELLDSQNQESTMDELIELHGQEQDIEKLESLDIVQAKDGMTVGNLAEGLSLIEKGFQILENTFSMEEPATRKFCWRKKLSATDVASSERAPYHKIPSGPFFRNKSLVSGL